MPRGFWEEIYGGFRGGAEESSGECFNGDARVVGRVLWGDFFPEWRWVNLVSGYKRRLMKNLEDLRSVCDEIIEEHLKKKKKEKNSEDFVDVLLRVQRQDDLEVAITDDNLKALVLVSSISPISKYRLSFNTVSC